MTELLDPLDYQYDAVAGVSVGSIGSFLIGSYPMGEEKKAIEEIEWYWKNYLIQDLWRTWPQYSIFGGIWKDALLDNTPSL